MITIIDYDAGNTFNVQKALQHIGLDAVLTADRDTILAADGVILPGVGAYASAVSVLRERGLIEVIHEVVERNIPLLGICLGMQLLFDESEEYGPTPGLGIIPGTVKAIPNNLGFRVPHMGWNTVRKLKTTLFQGINPGEWMYFVHSYYLEAADPSIVTATTEYGTLIHASVEKGNIFACQFHPEKSSRVGMKILQNFIEITQEFREKDKQGGR